MVVAIGGRENVSMRDVLWRSFLALAALILSAAAAQALDKVRVGKAVPNSFAFAGVEVGIEAKLFEQEGLEVEVSAFRGDAQLQQALTAGSVDIGFGSGPGMGFRAKGVPAVAVAPMYGPHANPALLVLAHSPVTGGSGLNGSRRAV